MIISFVLVTCMFDESVILWGEIRCWSLLGLKGLSSVVSSLVSAQNATANVSVSPTPFRNFSQFSSVAAELSKSLAQTISSSHSQGLSSWTPAPTQQSTVVYSLVEFSYPTSGNEFKSYLIIAIASALIHLPTAYVLNSTWKILEEDCKTFFSGYK